MNKKSPKILAVGNSFSVDAMRHLWGIFHAGGWENVILGNLYIPGCSLDNHYENIQSQEPAYIYYKNTAGAWEAQENVSIYLPFYEEKWDIVTVQQASGYSGMAETFTHLKDILEFIKVHQPQAKILWQMTWAYQQLSDHRHFGNYHFDQMCMYNGILKAVQSRVLPETGICGIIPTGTAIQNLRTSYLGDTLTRDGYHLSYGIGRYAAALCWYAFITGGSVDEISWIPERHLEVLPQHLPAIRQAVKLALEKPFEISKVDVSVEA